MASGSDGKTGAPALDDVKTQQRANAELDKKGAAERAGKASIAPETDDSPKRQGDKLENAVREAAKGGSK